MNSTVIAVYEKGVLRPLAPLALPEQARVQIHIQPIVSAEAAAHRRQVRETLVVAGLSLPAPDTPPPSGLLSAERRDELAHLFSAGRPLSELIIEEREER